MADIESSISSQVVDTISDVLNDTFGAATNMTGRAPASTANQAVSYVCLVLMAVVSIYIGSWKSSKKSEGEASEVITSTDAMQFPIIASCALFSIYLCFKFISKDYINLMMGSYFLLLGTFAMAQVLGPALDKIAVKVMSVRKFKLNFTETDKDGKNTDHVDINFDEKQIFAMAFSLVLSIWYLFTKHWMANNILGVAFAINAIALLKLNTIATGATLLGGLFFYDIFWVFGTNVMVKVATNLDAPIKVVFPQDFLENGFFNNSTRPAMLGLGDIVIPGIFIALLLRFDLSLGEKRRTYFYSGFVAYFIGLIVTMAVMVVFKHAQPALLYLVPSCLGIPTAVAAYKGELKLMFAYNDQEVTIEEAEVKGEKKQE